MNKDHLRDAERYLIDADRTENDGFADRLVRKAKVAALVAIATELRRANDLAAERRKLAG